MNSNLFQSSVKIFENLLDPVGNTIIGSALSAIAGPLTALLVIYVITTGILCTLGEFSARIAVNRVLRAGFVSMLLTATYFNPYVRDLFITNLPAWFATSVTHSPTTLTLPQQCDLIRSAMLHMAASIYQGTSWQDMDMRLGCYVATMLGTMFLGVLVLSYEVARTFMILTVCVAPFAIAAYLFDATKQFVEGWIGKVAGLSILQLLVSITAQIVVGADTTMMKMMATAPSEGALEEAGDLAALVVFFLMMSIVVVGLPSIAYSIGKGVALNTGAAAAMSMPGRMRQAFSNSSFNVRFRR